MVGTSRLGPARLGRFRLGAYEPVIAVTINGVTRSGLVRRIAITDDLNHTPNTASFRCRGFTPVIGHAVKIYMGDTHAVPHQLFAGHILSLTQGFEGKPVASLVYWDVQCIDYTWLLNRRPVIQRYLNVSATVVVQEVINDFTLDLGTAHLATDLPVLDEITFTDEEASDALTRIAQRIGAYWYIDYDRELHFYLTETETAGAITDAAVRGASDMTMTSDLSQVATRVTVRGGGSNTAADVAVGQTTIPLVDAATTWYDPAGGIVEVGPNRVTYTGVAAVSETGSTTGYIGAPAATFTVGPEAGPGSLDPSATYGYAFTYSSAEGETTPSVIVSGQSSAGGAARVDNIPVPTDPKITGKHVYRTEGGGSVLKALGGGGSIGVATITLAPDNASDASLGAVPPTLNSAGVASEPTPAGSTSLYVENLALFAASGWADVGGQVFRYTGRSATTGGGTLTGIPASGIGSLTADVRSSTVRGIPHLTGIPSSGAGSVLHAVNKGEQANLIVTVNDATAQTAMATAVGGDGVHEMFLTDGRWGITEATARANAELSERKDPLITITLVSRDPSLVAGRLLTITRTHPAISGTFRIQRVTLSEIGISGPRGRLFPLRTVELSSRRYSFEDLVRQNRSRAA
jgi:hypothetical protein